MNLKTPIRIIFTNVTSKNSIQKSLISLRSYFTLRFLLTGGAGLSRSHAEHLAESSSFLSVQVAQVHPLDLFLVLRIRSDEVRRR